MIGIHPVHRRLAELHLIAMQRGGYHRLTLAEHREVDQCVRINAKIVQSLDELKQLAYHAHEVGDMDWHDELCAKIDSVEATMI